MMLTSPRPTILWILSAFAALTGLLSYVIATPPPPKERALAYQRLAAEPDLFGWAMIAIALAVAVLAAFARTERLAGSLLVGGTTLWAGSFAWSIAFYHAGFDGVGPLLVWSMVAAVGAVTTRSVRGRGGSRG